MPNADPEAPLPTDLIDGVGEKPVRRLQIAYSGRFHVPKKGLGLRCRVGSVGAWH